MVETLSLKHPLMTARKHLSFDRLPSTDVLHNEKVRKAAVYLGLMIMPGAVVATAYEGLKSFGVVDSPSRTSVVNHKGQNSDQALADHLSNSGVSVSAYEKR